MTQKKKVKETAKEEGERIELLWRLLIFVVTGIILEVWAYLVLMVAIINFFIVLFSGNPDKKLTNFSEYFNTELYRYARYITFSTNERPFPFTEMKKRTKFEEK